MVASGKGDELVASGKRDELVQPLPHLIPFSLSLPWEHVLFVITPEAKCRTFRYHTRGNPYTFRYHSAGGHCTARPRGIPRHGFSAGLCRRALFVITVWELTEMQLSLSHSQNLGIFVITHRSVINWRGGRIFCPAADPSMWHNPILAAFK